MIVHFATVELGWHALLWYPSAVRHGLLLGECVVEVDSIGGLDRTIALYNARIFLASIVVYETVTCWVASVVGIVRSVP